MYSKSRIPLGGSDILEHHDGEVQRVRKLAGNAQVQFSPI
jgi:hypothetical protein